MYQALQEFAAQAHLQLVFATQDVDPSLISSSVVGTFTPGQALAALLRGSDLGYTFLNDRTVSVQANVPRSADTKHGGPQTQAEARSTHACADRAVSAFPGYRRR